MRVVRGAARDPGRRAAAYGVVLTQSISRCGLGSEGKCGVSERRKMVGSTCGCYRVRYGKGA